MEALSEAEYKKTIARSEVEWNKLGEEKALELFHQMAKRVPAYKDTLSKNKINPSSIKTIADFKKLPLLTKENYLKAYPLEKLLWDGDIGSAHQFASTSGSTGEPFYWAAGVGYERITRWHTDFMFRYNFQADKKRTLVVNCYALGTWMAGVLYNDILWDFARQGYPITLTSPGINKVEAVRTIQKLAPLYEQVLIIGYGPFLKDMIEESALQGMDWRAPDLALLTGGEAYNESWRDYMSEMLGIDRSRIVNKYASVDNGPMATETMLTMGLRKAAAEDPELGKAMYHQERQPSLVQYNPATHFAEEIDGELVFTRDHGIPLARYNITDNGGKMSFTEARKIYEQKVGKLPAGQPQMPLLYVFGRSHHTTTIYGLNLYPENVRAGAEDARIRKYLSGKTITVTGYDDDMNQQLEIILELAPGANTPDADTTIFMRNVFVERMSQQNSEYRELIRTVGEKGFPLLTFVSYGDSQFDATSKQKVQTKKK